MNSRRLARVLQAVAYDTPEYGQSMPARKLYQNRISIQEAVAMYMQTADSGCVAAMEANRIEGQCRKNAREQQALKKKEKQPAAAPKAEPHCAQDFDRLDANRTEGFLLYSYDKHGVHSVLGESKAIGNKTFHL